MPRSVNAVAAKERKKNVLKYAKGFFGRRKNVWTVAKNAVEKAWEYAYVGRKLKKRDMRSLWIARINAGCRANGLSYSKFINLLNCSGIEMNRKALADLALNNPEAFTAIVEKAKADGASGIKKEKTVVAKTSSKPSAKSAAKTLKFAEEKPATKKTAKVADVNSSSDDISVSAEEKPTKKATKKSETTGDDLKIVEGIGPAIEKLLHAKDITTFAQLADSSVESIQSILDEAGAKFSVHDPGTWAEQSALLRDGKMDEFNKLAEELKGGKREE